MGEDWGKLIVAKGFKNCPKSKISPNLVTLVPSLRDSLSNDKTQVLMMKSISQLDHVYTRCRYHKDRLDRPDRSRIG